MRTNLMMAAIAAVGMTMVSCSSDNENLVENEQPGKAHVRLVCGMGVSVSPMGAPRLAPMTRAALSANGKALTDLYILDYDKATGKLLQVLHQTSTATDFAEPDLTLDYGEHVLKVVATRSDNPTLLDATSAPWTVTANVLTPVSAAAPVAWTSDKTSDFFGAMKEIAVGVGDMQTVDITLERLVAKIVINSTDYFPTDASTISVTLDEYKTFSFADFSVIDCVKNQRVTDVSVLAGTTGTVINYFMLVPENGYTTDVTFTTNSTTGKPYSTITVPNVPLERNKVTTITGSLYNHQQGFSIKVNDEWNNEGHDINI